MTKEEISEFILNKVIPAYFIWEDGKEYNLNIYTEKYHTYLRSEHKIYDKPAYEAFPNWISNKQNFNKIMYFDRETGSHFREYRGENFKDILSDFLYWFELNKHKCKDIKYFEK